MLVGAVELGRLDEGGGQLQPVGVVGRALAADVADKAEEVGHVERDADPGRDLEGLGEGGAEAPVEEHHADLGQARGGDVEEFADPDVEALVGAPGGGHVPDVASVAEVLVGQCHHHGEGYGEGLFRGVSEGRFLVV